MQCRNLFSWVLYMCIQRARVSVRCWFAPCSREKSVSRVLSLRLSVASPLVYQIPSRAQRLKFWYIKPWKILIEHGHLSVTRSPRSGRQSVQVWKSYQRCSPVQCHRQSHESVQLQIHGSTGIASNTSQRSSGPLVRLQHRCVQKQDYCWLAQSLLRLSDMLLRVPGWKQYEGKEVA